MGPENISSLCLTPEEQTRYSRQLFDIVSLRSRKRGRDIPERIFFRYRSLHAARASASNLAS